MSVLLFGVNCLFSLLVRKDSNQALWQFMEELLPCKIAKRLPNIAGVSTCLG
jgi:hypothetical protein